MKKPNGNNRDWFGYLMNFVAVCLGIVITFAGQGMINRSAEKKEVKSSLALVKSELQDNLSYIELADSVLADFFSAAQFLRELSRLQTSHNSSEVKATIANTIASIDRYIR